MVENVIFKLKTTVEDGDDAVKLAATVERVDKEYAEAQKTINGFNQQAKQAATSTQRMAQENAKATSTVGTMGKTVADAGKGINNMGKEAERTAGSAQRMSASTTKASQDVDRLATSSRGLTGALGDTARQFASFFALDALVRSFFGVINGGVQSVYEFEDVLAELSSITGATGEDLKFLQDQAIAFSEASTVSAADVARAFTAIGSARPDLLKNKEALAAVTQETIALAEAAKIDLGTAGSAVAGAMNQFGLGAGDAARIVNALAAGSLEGAANISEVGDTIDKVGTVLAANNVTFEQGVALTETLAEKNLKGAEAGTQLRNVILRMVQAGKGFVNGQFNINAALTQTKAELDAIEDPAARAAAATKLFGLESTTAANILLENVGTFERLTEAVTGTQTAYEQQAKNNDTVAASATKLKNAVNNLFLAFTGSTGAVKDVLGFLAENLATIVKVTGVAIGSFLAYRAIIVAVTAAKVAYRGALAIATVYKIGFKTATEAATFSVRAFGTALKSTPLGLIVSGLAAAASYFFLFSDAADDATKKDKAFSDQLSETELALERRNKRIADISKNVNDVSTEDIRSEIQALQEELDNFDPSLVEKAFEDVGILEDGKQSNNPLARRIARLYDGFKDQVKLTSSMTSKDIDALFASISAKVNEAAKREIAAEIDGLKKLLEERDRALNEGNKGGGFVAGSIKALQEEQKRLATLLTDKLVIGSPKFFQVRDQYLRVTEELKKAQDLMKEADIPEVFPAGSLNDLNQELRFLQNVLNNLPADAENFDAVNDRVKEIQGLIDELNRRIRNTPSETAKGLLAELQERQRHALEVAELDKEAALTRARNARASEEDLLAIEQTYNEQILNLQLDFERERLALLEKSGTATESELTAQRNKIRELQLKLGMPKEVVDNTTKSTKELVEEVVAASEQIAQAGIDAWSAWSDAQEQALDLQVSQQQQRVEEARELADKGNSVVLEQEKKRLQALNDERLRAARRSAAIAQIEAAAAGTVAIARAAAEGGGFLSAITIASTLIALTAGIAQARALTTNAIPSFRKGGGFDWSTAGGYTGAGNPNETSAAVGGKPYIYHRDEYIQPHEVLAVGDNRRWMERIHRGRLDIGKLVNRGGGVPITGKSGDGTDRIVRAIENQPQTQVHMDGEGISVLVRGRLRQSNMLDTRR